jgi:transcriptional regulator with XRE-family HTH domain
MEKIAINPQRLKWCCETLGITVSSLFQDVKISEATLNKAFEHQAVLSINQLEKIADYFNQSLLFFIEKTEATAENIYSPAFRTINNQQPIESRKLRKFIANVEKQRKIYLNLLDDLQTPVSMS